MSRPTKPRQLPFKEEHNYLMTDPVFIIGNGKSREKFDLERLRGKGTIIGCNALFRDFTPDILICIDSKMVNEVKQTDYLKDGNVMVVPANRNAQVPHVLKWRTDAFNTSGCFAMKLVSELMKPSQCYMIGMDGFPGNMYDKTKNYSVNTLQNFSGVLNFYMQVLKKKESTVFINVNEKDAWPKEAKDTGRYEFISFEEFENRIFK